MKILGIESSAMTASVALVEDGIVVAEYSTDFKQTHSQTLLPMLDEICCRVQWDVSEVDVIAISSGPGSFTGLRIGSATAKGLGLALGKPLVEVPTLEGLCFNLAGTDRLVCAMMDARRGNVYAGGYSFLWPTVKDCVANTEAWPDVAEKEPGLPKAAPEAKGTAMEEAFVTATYVPQQCFAPELISVGKLMEKLNELGESVVFVGDAVLGNLEAFKAGLCVDWRIAPVQSLNPRAASIAVLGGMLAHQGKLVSAAQHAPDYLRPSQAERERNEGHN